MGFFYPQWQKITRIGVTTPPTTTGYQVKVGIPWQPGMRDDFADLRFSDYYRTLPYWIETSTTRVTATVWIKLTEINQASLEFFMYYGCGGAVSESSGDNTFDFFDDFLGSGLDTNKWTDTSIGTHTLTVSNSEIRLTVTDSAMGSHFAGVKAVSQNATDTTIQMFKAKCASQYGYETALRMYNRENHSQTFGYRSDHAGTRLVRQFVEDGIDWSSAYEQSLSYNTYYVFESRFDTTANILYGRKDYGTWSTWTGRTGSDLSDRIGFSANAYWSAYNDMYLDWVAQRKYAATEPTCTPAESGINTAFYQALLRAKHVFDVATYPYTLAVSFITDHMHLTWTEP